LKWGDNLEYVANDRSAGEVFSGFRVQHLSIVNESGQKNIPLHVGIVGANKILNDGKANVLTMRITNVLPADGGSITLNKEGRPILDPPRSEFIFTFDSSNTEAWALGTTTEVAAINIKASASGKAFGFKEPEQGQSPQWSIWPKETVTLAPDEFIEVTLSNIKSSLPAGLTNVYVHYKNIPGYWDGDFVDQIEKAPVVYKEQGTGNDRKLLVGVGTNDPKSTLHVAGKAQVDGDLSVGAKVTVDKLRVEKLVSVGGTAVVAVDAPHIPGGRLLIDEAGKVSIQQLRVESDVSIGGDGVIAIDAHKRPAGRLYMHPGGKVGIGTSDPTEHLHVAGVGDQGITIQSTDPHGGVKWALKATQGGEAANKIWRETGRFDIINGSANETHFTIQRGGNVGIGTIWPGHVINTGDFFKPDKDGRIVEIYSKQNEASINFSSDQDSDAHR
jgi:hypothetical protein